MKRRDLLKSLGALTASATIITRGDGRQLDNVPAATSLSSDTLPRPAHTGGFKVLTDPADRATLEALFDRLIPEDELGASASQAGCIEFLDDQLAGDYGAGKALYLSGPFDPENEAELMAEPQFLATPRERYETGLKALRHYSQSHFQQPFEKLSPQQVDDFLEAMEAGHIDLGDGINSQALFELMLQNVREGYLADPLYGGNKDMVGWRMIGFPGARYDYRKYVDQRGEQLSLIPVSLIPEA